MYKIKRFNAQFYWDLYDIYDLIEKSRDIRTQFIKLLITKFPKLKFITEIDRISELLDKQNIDCPIHLVEGLSYDEYPGFEFPDDFINLLITIRNRYENNNFIPICISSGVYLIYDTKSSRFYENIFNSPSRLKSTSVRDYIDSMVKFHKTNSYALSDKDYNEIVNMYKSIK